MDNSRDYDEKIRKKLDELLFGDNSSYFPGYKYKGKNSICSTCKHFNGDVCAKKKSFAGFATKLADCGEWEVCNG